MAPRCLLAGCGGAPVDVTINSAGGTTTLPNFSALIVPGLVDRMKTLYGCIDLAMDEDTFEISGGDRQAVEDNAVFSLEWTGFHGVYAPTGETPG